MEEAKLKEIKAAEDKAAGIIEDAKKEYSKIVSEAGEKGISLFEQEKSKIKNEYNESVNKFKKEGESEAGKTLSTLDKELSQVDTQSNRNKKQAVEYLIDRIKVKYGNR